MNQLTNGFTYPLHELHAMHHASTNIQQYLKQIIDAYNGFSTSYISKNVVSTSTKNIKSDYPKKKYIYICKILVQRNYRTNLLWQRARHKHICICKTEVIDSCQRRSCPVMHLHLLHISLDLDHLSLSTNILVRVVSIYNTARSISNGTIHRSE